MLKDLDNLTFADDFMFGKVLENEEICKEFIETLLNIKVSKIEYNQLQREINPSYEGRGVRFDVFVSDENRIFDIEIQVAKKKEIGMRMRYYQNLMDYGAISKGASFRELKENYVIFICMFDPFDKGYPVYFFENSCRVDKNLTLSDKVFKICYNVNAFEKEENAKLKAILEYLKTHQATDNFTAKIDEIVANSKISDDEKRNIMFGSLMLKDAYDDGKEEGYSLGIEDGIEQGALNNARETARNLLSLGIATNEQIAQATGLSLAEVEQLAKS